ncbi:MAG: NADH:ubiquinone reductase (Na(+)-transporting) subunit C, partial [Muribaculaceae bacterium]|nr:NADH:ubiquinone reductase (Na(+)-transporting) subunit C [Muribaculaceae bacterium]
MNKQSNLYTIIYIVVLVVVVGAALAFTAISLKPRQQSNADADKMRQILASVNISVPSDEIAQAYDKYISASFVIDEQGRRIEGADAFNVNVAAESKTEADRRMLPVYECRLDDGAVKYIMPMYGAGLWGPIWGYMSVDSDGSTVYGAFFAHQGETPGLGAEIEKPHFCNQFSGKHLVKDGRFMPVAVVKAGMAPQGDEDYVDGISGGTITSKGV